MPRPKIITASFPKAASKPEQFPAWSSQFSKEMDAFLYNLERIIQNGGGVAPNSVSSSSTPPFSSNADTLDGYHAHQLISISRSNSFWLFANPLSGPILRASPNGGQFRLFVSDRTFGLEPKGTWVAGDYELPVGGYVVLRGRFSDRLFRLVVSDSDINAPILGLSETSSVSFAADFWFQSGTGFLLRDRELKETCLPYINDSEGEPILALEVFGYFD